MREVWEVLARGQPVQPFDVHGDWVPYVESFFKHRRWPRYYLTSADMSADTGHFWWVVHEGCLLVYRRVAQYGYYLHLSLPPLSLSGDLQKEAEVLRWLEGAGVGARLSEEDLALYGFTDYTRCPYGPEFVYRAGDYTELAGKPWFLWRNVRNNTRRLGWTSKLYPLGEITLDVQRDLRRISEEWGVTRKKPPKRALKIVEHLASDVSMSFLAEPVGEGWVTVSYSPDGEARAWSFFQKVHENRAVYVVKHWYGEEYPSRDASRCIHLMNAWRAVEHEGSDLLYNIGSGAGRPGQEKAKRTLKPHHELMLYRSPIRRKLTKADWEESKAR